jgi:hypothetical protein
MSKIDIGSYVVRHTDGSVDLDATVDQFATDVQEYVNTVEADGKLCGTAVNAVFDQYKGTNISMPALSSLALHWIDGNVGKLEPSEYVPMSVKIHDYVVNHKDQYVVAKGKGGGVKRVSDIPVKA